MSIIQDYSDTYYADGSRRPDFFQLKNTFFIDGVEVTQEKWYAEQRKDTERLLFEVEEQFQENVNE